MFEYNQNNIFAKIIRQEILAKIVYQDEYLLAFYDIKPEASVHILLYLNSLIVIILILLAKPNRKKLLIFCKK